MSLFECIEICSFFWENLIVLLFHHYVIWSIFNNSPNECSKHYMLSFPPYIISISIPPLVPTQVIFFLKSPHLVCHLWPLVLLILWVVIYKPFAYFLTITLGVFQLQPSSLTLCYEKWKSLVPSSLDSLPLFSQS